MSARSRSRPWFLDGRDRPSIANITMTTMEAGRRASRERFDRLICRFDEKHPERFVQVGDRGRGRYRLAVRDHVAGLDVVVVQRDTHVGRMRNEDAARASLRAKLLSAWDVNQPWLVASGRHLAETLRRCA